MSVKNKSVEIQMEELRRLAAWFENDEFSLDEATKKYEEAIALARDITSRLKKIENDVTVLKQSFEAA